MPAPRAPGRSVAVRISDPALVRFEIQDVFVDEGPTLEPGHAGRDQADFRIWRRESDGRAHEGLRCLKNREDPRLLQLLQPVDHECRRRASPLAGGQPTSISRRSGPCRPSWNKACAELSRRPMNIALTARPQERERSARTTRPVDAGVAEDNRVIICGRARTVGRRLPSATWTAARALRRARTIARSAVHSATQALLPRSSIVDARRIESALPEEPRRTSPLQLSSTGDRHCRRRDASRPALSSASPPRSAGDLTTRARDVGLQLGL
jgi:hypothetical protein